MQFSSTSNAFRLPQRRQRRYQQMSGFGDVMQSATIMENVSEAFKRAQLDLRVHIAGLAMNSPEMQKIAASVGLSSKAEVTAKLDEVRASAARLEGELYDAVLGGSLPLGNWLALAQDAGSVMVALARAYSNSAVANLVSGQLDQAHTDMANMARQVQIAPPPTTLVEKTAPVWAPSRSDYGPGGTDPFIYQPTASAAAESINSAVTVATAEPGTTIQAEKPFPYLLVGGAVAAGALLFALS